MTEHSLHITNGDSLGERIQKSTIPGKMLIWREMLCQGPTALEVGSSEFIERRERFLQEYYSIPVGYYKEHFIKELNKLTEDKTYDAIYLWFEYDLFCHVNMLAAISYIRSKNRKESVYLICSGRVKGEKRLLGLSELNDKQFIDHYQNPIQLNALDLSLANTLWEFYCGDDHNKLKPKLAQYANFEYLSNCLEAHLERFPDSTGLNTLEKHTLRFIAEKNITSKNQLCDYMLNHQGYYGYGDTQILPMINRLEVFYNTANRPFTLNENGNQILKGIKPNTKSTVKTTDTYFGGVLKYDYVYDEQDRKLNKAS